MGRFSGRFAGGRFSGSRFRRGRFAGRLGGLDLGATVSLFQDGQTPAVDVTDDDTSYEMGVRFLVTASAELVALRYYRSPGDAGDSDTRTLYLWDRDTNQALASATVTAGPGQSGWIVAPLATPYALQASKEYVASFGTVRNYSATPNYFTTERTSADGLIEAPAGENGVFTTEPANYPSASFNSTSYWVDVMVRAIEEPVEVLAAPPNLFTAAQAAFDTTAHLDLRSNWQVAGGAAQCLNVSNNDLRATLDAAIVPGRPHFALVDWSRTSGTLKINLAGSGSVSGRTLSDPWMNFEWYPSAAVVNPYTRASLVPSSLVGGEVDNIRLFDLSSVDPNQVACDVIIVGGDSNSANATSQRFGTAAGEIGPEARETPFDPRIWYMPCLRASPTNALTVSQRHVPQPCIEPVAAVSAQRMSPVHAVAGQLVEWSAARGRPLLIMALGDPGSGLMNTEDWRKTSAVPTTGARMWGEMLAMKAALEALGPAHEIVGAVWSLGANDQFAGTYETNHGPVYSQFFADVRADIADVPMVLWNIGDHLNSGQDGRSPAMRTFLRRFDHTSGDPRAIDRFKVVEPPAGNQLSDDQDPHYNAAGMQANGRAAGDALLSLLAA